MLRHVRHTLAFVALLLLGLEAFGISNDKAAQDNRVIVYDDMNIADDGAVYEELSTTTAG